MLTVTANIENRIDINFSGKIDSEEMGQALDTMLELTTDFVDGKMLYQIGEFKMPTLGAIGVELSRIPQLFRLLGRITRVAVVCNQEWLQKVAEIEGLLIPNLEVKGFTPQESDEAEKWLNES